MTPASGKSLFDSGASHNNSWGGPIMTAPDGTFHLFMPLYRNGSLSGPTSMKHGIAQVITGPYDWTAFEDLPLTGENPAAVAFVDPATGKKQYSLWSGGQVFVADSPSSKFSAVAGFTYPGGNPAPMFYNGSFYMTNQETTTIFTTPALAAGARWTVFSNISHAALPTNEYHVECVSRINTPPTTTRAAAATDPHNGPTPAPPGTPSCGWTPKEIGTSSITLTPTSSTQTAGAARQAATFSAPTASRGAFQRSRTTTPWSTTTARSTCTRRSSGPTSTLTKRASPGSSSPPRTSSRAMRAAARAPTTRTLGTRRAITASAFCSTPTHFARARTPHAFSHPPHPLPPS